MANLKAEGPIEVFFSYSHKDEELRDKLATHLSTLRHQGVINDWHDRRIGAGSEWAGAIDQHLNGAQVILLLVSADFQASDYCYDLEMKRALERHEAGEARVIPVILRPVDWQGAPFGKLQALPKDGKPVTSWANSDEAFLDVAKGIRAAIEGFGDRKEKASYSTTFQVVPQTDKIKWEMEFSAKIDEKDKTKIEEIVAYLRTVSGDAELTIESVKGGFLIFFEGSKEGFIKIKRLFESQGLTEIYGNKIMRLQVHGALRANLRNEFKKLRKRADYKFGKIAHPAAVPALLKGLKGDKRLIREGAILSLVAIGSPAVPALIEALKDDNWRVRSGVVTVLGKIRDPSAVQTLTEALESADKILREAVLALKRIGTPVAMKAIKEYEKMQEDAAKGADKRA